MNEKLLTEHDVLTQKYNFAPNEPRPIRIKGKDKATKKRRVKNKTARKMNQRKR